MSSGPSAMKLKPRSALSTCRKHGERLGDLLSRAGSQAEGVNKHLHGRHAEVKEDPTHTAAA